MPTFFTIEKLNAEYSWKDFELCDLAYDYAVDIHNIPEEYIESIDVSIELEKVEITLVEDKTIIHEDWYHSLLHHAA